MVKTSPPAAASIGHFLPAVLLVLVSLSGALAASAQPPASGPIAMVFPPWWGAARSVMAAASAGRVIRLGALPFVVVVAPEGVRSHELLHRSGAVLLLAPLILSGCPDGTGRAL